jgi:uncharacterized protein (DUF2336 family)
MMPAAQSLITELDATLSNISDARHLVILRRVTDLFLVGAENYSNEQIAIFDDVISRLIEDIGQPALLELSSRLAPVSKAPKNVVTCLSGLDDIAIAGPALEKSGSLTDDALVEIAGTKSQKHLAAIARRAQINQIVTDVLVDRGNAEVACLVTANLGARLSEIGFVKLIKRAKADKALASAIASRTDIPSELEPFLKLALA